MLVSFIYYLVLFIHYYLVVSYIHIEHIWFCD